MSVFFANLGINGDRIGVINPAMRNKVLASIYELQLFGPSLKNGNGCPRMSNRRASNNKRPRLKPGMQTNGQTHPDKSKDQPGDVRKTPRKSSDSIPHGILKDKSRTRTPQSITQTAETGSVKVNVRVLHREYDNKIIEITTQTTSEQLISEVLEVCDAFTKDPNVYYIAMETGIKQKDSGLPISQIIVLDNDNHPLELQSCQPQGETSFHLKMRSGGLVRVRASVLTPGASHKTVYIARNTTARQLIKLLIKTSNSDESPDNFLLRESSANLEVDRIIDESEYPLQIQSRWEPEDDISFFLTRKLPNVSKSREVEATPASEVQKKDMDKRHQITDLLQDYVTRMRHGKVSEKGKDTEEASPANERRTTQGSIDSGYGRSDTEQVGEMERIEETCDPFHDDMDPEKKRKMIDRLRKRRTSLDALDLHNVPSEKPSEARERKVSQIERFRHKFFEYKKSEIDALDLHDDDKPRGVTRAKPQRRVSQIDRFRNKFMEYYHVKGDDPQRRFSHAVDYSSKHEKHGLGEFRSTSDPDIPKTERHLSGCPIETLSRKSSSSELSDHEMRYLFAPKSNGVHSNMSVSMFKLVENKKLIAVTLSREHGDELGLELAQVTQTGNQIDNLSDEEVVYVLHTGDGNNSVLTSPTDFNRSNEFIPISGSNNVKDGNATGSANHEDLPCASDEFPSNVRSRRKMGIPHVTITETSEETASSIAQPEEVLLQPPSPASSHSSSVLESMRRRGSPAPSPGVRIVGITQGSVAAEAGIIQTDDLIVEVNGRNVLDSTLDGVIASLQEHDIVYLVLARDTADDLSRDSTPRDNTSIVKQTAGHENTVDVEENVPRSYFAELQALTSQVRDLVTKVSEMQEALGQKDKTISTLKKALVKKKLKISSKDKLVEGKQILV
ncbi:uncharacterized protein LOC5517974 isoform X2 [Nematostella vectensis]|uniref:uncharacterized protein LOC5517974 isoform X2 n=1 Tax=Nematostella vectensis TaxID=45351 RepID=UPI0020777226|nr:uncharacterized protein LOC5517974 isoform X2 [Nematostella vectensis]